MSLTISKLRASLAGLTVEPSTDANMAFSVAKQQEENRYTLGVMYVPGARDSDNEYAEVEDLQKAVWDYVRSGYRQIRDTHTNAEIGELVELVCWPYPVEVEAQIPGEPARKMKLPAGSVFAGVIWAPPAWDAVKVGKLRGYSLGGRAVRMKDAVHDDELPKMLDYAMQTGEEPKAASADCGCGCGCGDGVVKEGKAPRCPLGHGGKNWVTKTGGLPSHIEIVAEAIHCHEPDEQRSIAIAVGMNEGWCSGKHKASPTVKAASCSAVAEWNAKRAASKAETAAHKARRDVLKYDSSQQLPDDHTDYNEWDNWLDATDSANADDETVNKMHGLLPDPEQWDDLAKVRGDG